MKMKLSSLKKFGSKRWKSKKHVGPLTVGSISLAGNCFSDELDYQQKNHGIELNRGISAGHQLHGSLANSLVSVYSSELELGQHSSSGHSSGPSTSLASTSRSSSMITSSSQSSHMSRSWSNASLMYLDEDENVQLDQADERTLFLAKDALSSKRPTIAIRV